MAWEVVGHGSDGACVMASELNGVNVLLRQQNPFLIVWHRLNLATAQTCTGTSEMATLYHGGDEVRG